VTDTTRDDVRSAVKIEAGAKSALDPNIATSVRPYAADDLPDLDLCFNRLSARNLEVEVSRLALRPMIR